MSAKKYFTTDFCAFNTQSMSGSIYLHQSVSLSPTFPVSAFIFLLTLTSNTQSVSGSIYLHQTVSLSPTFPVSALIFLLTLTSNTQSMSGSIYLHQTVSLSPSSKSVPSSSSSHSLPIHRACQVLSTFTNQCYCLHFQSQCLHLPPHTHFQHSHPLHCHSTIYHHQFHPLHWIYSTSYNPSQSLLVTCATMPLQSTLMKEYFYIPWFINLLKPIRIHNFLRSGVTNCQYMYSGFLYCVCGLISLSSWLFMVFN